MDEIKNELRSRLGEYISLITKPSRSGGRNMFICPICGSGSGGLNSDGALHVDGDQWYCHSASHDSGGDIFELYAQLHDLSTKTDFPKIVEGLSNELGINSARSDFEPIKKERKEVSQRNPERASQIEKFSSQIAGSPAETYLKERGFSDEVIKVFRLGYDSAKNAVVIPYPEEDYFTERRISPADDQAKYDNLPGTAPTFKIKLGSSDYYFITEGQLDALSMIQAGAKNVIASHYPTKIEKLIDDGLKIDGAVIVADQDDPGKKIAQTLTELFTEKKIKSLGVFPPDGFKDSSAVLSDDATKLSAHRVKWRKDCQSLDEVEKNDVSALKAVNVGDYIKSGDFDVDIEYFRLYRGRKTGFSNIDKYLTLYPGLACLTGATSLGKTSFCVQLADQLVKKGETVLYFSLEQLTIELVTKLLARNYYTLGGENFNNIDIKNGATDEILESVKKDYAQRAKRLNIIECDFTISADKIVDFVTNFVNETQIRPIVIIDYLQIISAPDGERFDERQRIDDAVKKFKLMTKENEIFALMISNMARSTYRERIGEDSFKESGLIEYTCDYLFGLQLAILEDDSFFSKEGSRGGQKETLKSEKQTQLDQASEAIPKEVVFKAMKNRNGKKVFRAFFEYYPNYDYFKEDDNSKYDPESPSFEFVEVDEPTSFL